MLILPCICRSRQAEQSAGKERHSLMKRYAKAILLTACSGMLLAGCGANAEHPEPGARRAETSARAASTTSPADHNSLYETDDVHRETGSSAPDIMDRAETAVSKAADKAKDMVTDAKKAASDAAADMTETTR